MRRPCALHRRKTESFRQLAIGCRGLAAGEFFKKTTNIHVRSWGHMSVYRIPNRLARAVAFEAPARWNWIENISTIPPVGLLAISICQMTFLQLSTSPQPMKIAHQAIRMGVVAYQNPHFNISFLRGLGKVCRSHQCRSPIDNDTFCMKASSLASLRKCARVVVQHWQCRPRPMCCPEFKGKPTHDFRIERRIAIRPGNI